MYAKRSATAHQGDNLHPIARPQKMLAVLLPGDQLQVHLDGQRFAGKPQLLEQRGQRGSVGDLARLTVHGYLNVSTHRLFSEMGSRRRDCIAAQTSTAPGRKPPQTGPAHV